MKIGRALDTVPRSAPTGTYTATPGSCWTVEAMARGVGAGAEAQRRGVEQPAGEPGVRAERGVQCGRPHEHQVAERVGRAGPTSGSSIGARPEPVIVMAIGVADPGVEELGERTRVSGPRSGGAGSPSRRATRTTGPACRRRSPRARSRSGASRSRRRLRRRRRLGHGDAADRLQPGELVGADRAHEAHLRVDPLEARGAIERRAAPSPPRPSGRGSRRARGSCVDARRRPRRRRRAS